MSEYLDGFLVDLATDPRLMLKFWADPEAAMKGKILDDNERAALSGGDGPWLLQAIKKAGEPTQVNDKAKIPAKGKKQIKKKGGKKKGKK
jgi:hypothetical protein